MINQPRIIKKYPNRRLYDTVKSQYVTLEDLRTLVLEQIEFQVIDIRTKEDLTNQILLQIISEQESSGTPIFTKALLRNIICFYGNAMQETMSKYMEEGLALFTNQETDWRKTWPGMEHDSIKSLAKIAQQNLAIWQSILEKYDTNAGPASEKK